MTVTIPPGRRLLDRGAPAASVGSWDGQTTPAGTEEQHTVNAQGRQWTIFFVYTLWSMLVVVAMTPLALLFTVDLTLPQLLGRHPVASALIAGQTILGIWFVRTTLRRWARDPGPTVHGRWDLPELGVLPAPPWHQALLALPTLVMVPVILAGTAPTWLLLVSAGTAWIALMIRTPWWRGVAGAIGLGLIGHLGGDFSTIHALTFTGLLAGLIVTIRSSLWLAAVVRELDDARAAQSQLAVAEERLRFARDLHDVTGRDLSAIAVKSELVAQLVEREDHRALEHSREVAQIARTSLAEIRALVRGYREVDLEAELQGTISLLRSARVEVGVEGTAASIPAHHDQLAAWVLREGGTNVLRHSDPRHVTITLGASGIRLLNDGAPAGITVREGSGLKGLRERLGHQATLETRLEGGTFLLEVTFADAPTDVPPHERGSAPAARPGPTPPGERP